MPVPGPLGSLQAAAVSGIGCASREGLLVYASLAKRLSRSRHQSSTATFHLDQTTLDERPYLQEVPAWQAFVQCKEACGCSTLPMRKQGWELGMQMCAEPVGWLERLQQLLCGRTTQLP